MVDSKKGVLIIFLNDLAIIWHLPGDFGNLRTYKWSNSDCPVIAKEGVPKQSQVNSKQAPQSLNSFTAAPSPGGRGLRGGGYSETLKC